MKTARTGSIIRGLATGLALLLGACLVGPLHPAAAGPEEAEEARPERGTADGPSVERATYPEELFDDLAAHEDESLADHRAGHMSGGQAALVVIFLIVFFPLGVLLLIIYIAEHHHPHGFDSDGGHHRGHDRHDHH